MQKKPKLGLAWQMMIGLVLGIAAGALVDTEFAKTWFAPLGDLFIRLIRMVVVPLVVATIIAGAAGISDTAKLGRVAGKVLGLYAATTAVAVAVGLLFADLIRPGVGIDLSAQNAQAAKVAAPALVDTLLNIVPVNPLAALAEGQMLQIIFFAVLFGFGLSALGERGKPVLDFFTLVGDTMIQVTHAVMKFAPIGVFGLISFTVSRYGLSVLLPLGQLILTALIATVVFVFLVLVPLMRVVAGIPMKTFLRHIFEPWLVAFTTCSSAAALPANFEAARRLGATRTIASFAIPLGNTINMNGTAIYMGVCAIFAGEVYGLNLTIVDQLTVVLMGVLAAVGTAGVPGAGLIMTTVVFTQIGIPVEAVALIAGIDRILDMIRTSVNVVGDVASAVMVTKLEGELDSEPVEEGAA